MRAMVWGGVRALLFAAIGFLSMTPAAANGEHQSGRDGIDPGGTLWHPGRPGAARQNRDMRMAKAEKKAAALSPKLTVPMIVFPVLFVVILGRPSSRCSNT